jgi:hypothetical protein
MMILSIFIFIAGLFIGYVYGKHVGLTLGQEKGKSEMPLLLRQQSLEQGYCTLCNELIPCINQNQNSNNRQEGGLDGKFQSSS